MEPIEMNPLNLPSNSKSKQTQETHIEPVVQQVAIKTPWYRKLGNTFLAEDTTSVKSFVIREVIVPTIKDTFYQIVTGGLSMYLYGNTKAAPNRNRGSNTPNGGSYISYGGISTGAKPNKQIVTDSNSGRMTYRDWVFEDSLDENGRPVSGYTKAQNAEEKLISILEQYGVVYVSDYYDAVGISAPVVARGWCWRDLSSARISKVYGGWILELPQPQRVT